MTDDIPTNLEEAARSLKVHKSWFTRLRGNIDTEVRRFTARQSVAALEDLVVKMRDYYKHIQKICVYIKSNDKEKETCPIIEAAEKK